MNRCAKDSLPFSAASALEASVHDWMRVYERFVDHYTFSSDFMADATRSFWSGQDFSWSKLLNPFDSRRFEAGDGDKGYGLYFGRLIEEKGVDILVEAAALAPEVAIKIVGSGPDEDALRERAAALGLANVEFLGPLWNEELAPVLSAARFVVIPSIWHENFPYVINQAFAYGRPVIGADRGGITELVDHEERGLVYDAQNIEALAAAMRRLNENPELARRLGRAAKQWSDSVFVDDVFYASLQEAYEKARHAYSHARR